MNSQGMILIAVLAILLLRKAWNERHDLSKCLYFAFSAVAVFLGALASKINLWYALYDVIVIATVVIGYYYFTHTKVTFRSIVVRRVINVALAIWIFNCIFQYISLMVRDL